MEPYEGAHVWVWESERTELATDFQKAVEMMSQRGIRGVILKAHDGRDSSFWLPRFEQLLNRLKPLGFIVGAWGYNYFNDVGAEAQSAIRALKLGADWYVADPEIEVENALDNTGKAVEFLDTIKASLPSVVLGYSTFPIVRFHTKFPYAAFDRYCDVAMPQCYWNTIGMAPDTLLKRTIAEYRAAELIKPIAPVGQSYNNVPPNEMSMFRAMLGPFSKEFPGVSWWSWQHATPEMWLNMGLAYDAGLVRFVEKDMPTLSFGMKGEAVKLIQRKLGLEQSGNFDLATHDAVCMFQQGYGLPVDGTAGKKTWEALEGF